MAASAWGIADSITPPRKELLTTSTQRALQHLLKPIHLERLLQRRPVAIGLSQLAIPRRKDERHAAGNEGIGNWRDGLAVEIGVEDRKVEVGVLRRFQRLVDARGFGGDGVAEFAEHVLEQHADHHLVFDDEDPLGLRRGLRFGCHPSPLRWNGTHPGRIGLTMHCGCPGAKGWASSKTTCRAGTAWGPAAWSAPAPVPLIHPAKDPGPHRRS